MHVTSKTTSYLPRCRVLSFTGIAYVISVMTQCQSFTSRSQLIPPSASCRPLAHWENSSSRYLFRELISDDEEDLRADIAVIRKQDGLEQFLRVDDRLCVVK